MPKSKKPQVFEQLFRWRYDADGNKSPRWDDATQTIPDDRRLVYSDEVVEAARETRAGLGNNVAANFTKDFLRKGSRNENWPESIARLRWTMQQVTGKDSISGRPRNFVWKPYAHGQNEPFPDDWPIPDNPTRHSIQSVTLSIASKQIDRLDEPRLMQIAVDLRVVETHFALYSPLAATYKLVHMDHLQMGLKLRGSEVDGLYLAEFRDEQDKPRLALVTVEAKKSDEFVNSSQVVAQVEAASGLGVEADFIVPIALKHGDGGMYIFEYKPYETNGAPFERDSIDGSSLQPARPEGPVFYDIKPEMPGLSRRARRPRTVKSVDGALVLDAPEPAHDISDEDDDE